MSENSDDNFNEERVPPKLTDAQRAELERRLADHKANPDDVVSWKEIKARALARFQKS